MRLETLTHPRKKINVLNRTVSQENGNSKKKICIGLEAKELVNFVSLEKGPRLRRVGYISGEALTRFDDVSYHVVPAPGLHNYDWDKRHISCPSFRVPRQHNCNLQANHLQHIFQEIVPSNS